MRMRYSSVPWVRYKADETIRQFLLSAGKIKIYKKDEIVVPTNCFYPYLSLIVKGVLTKGFDVRYTTKMFSCSILLPGSTVGDFYFMAKEACNLEIRAIRETALMEVPHDVVSTHMATSREFTAKLLRQFMLNTASDSEGLATLSARPADERLKILLKIFVIRYNVKPDGDWYKIPVRLTHEEMGRIVFATPLTINRFFIKFKKDGMFRKNGVLRELHRDLFNGIHDWNPDDGLVSLPE